MDKDRLIEILKLALGGSGEYADIYLERRICNEITCEDNKIGRIVSGIDVGAGIRVIAGDCTRYASVATLNEVEIKKLAGNIANTLPRLEKEKQGKDNPRTVELGETKRIEPEIVHKIERPPQEIRLEEKIDLVLLGNKVARAVDRGRIKQVSIRYSDTTLDITFASISPIRKYGAGNPFFVEERRVYTTYLITVIAREGDRIQTSYEPAGGLIGFELFRNCDVSGLARRAGERAVKMLFAKRAPCGEMPVVLEASAGGTMIHEAIGHSLEADAIQKRISPAYRGKLGKKVTSELITVIDDPTLPNLRGSFSFDDEGVPAQKTVLVEKGFLKSYLYDRFTAEKDGRQSTGNGRRESYQYKPIPRMSNTYILPGDSSPSEIVRAVKKGILVRRMGGGQVNTATGDFVFDVEEAYEIDRGRIGEMVRGATLIGNGPEVLNSIIMVGSDLGFSIGTCGKSGQSVPVSDGQPTLLIERLTVGGTET